MVFFLFVLGEVSLGLLAWLSVTHFVVVDHQFPDDTEIFEKSCGMVLILLFVFVFGQKLLCRASFCFRP